MIDYKYPTIASGAIPTGSTGRAPDKKYFEKTMNEEQGKKSSSPWTRHLLPSGERIVHPAKFLANQDISKIYEVED
jgi:hypothetical protein